MALMARAFNQAQKFGAEIAIPEEAQHLGPDLQGEARFQLTLSDGQSALARSIVLASGRAFIGV